MANVSRGCPYVNFDFQQPTLLSSFLYLFPLEDNLPASTNGAVNGPTFPVWPDEYRASCDQLFFCFFSFNTTPDWIISAPWSLHHCSFQQTKHGGLRKQKRKSSSELSVAAYMAFLVLIKLVDLSRYEGYDLVDRTAFERRGRTVTWNHVSGLVLRSCSSTGTFYTCGLVHYGKSGNQYSESALDLMKWRQLGVESRSVIATPRARLRPFPAHTKPFGVIAV